jgi:allantoicase
MTAESDLASRWLGASVLAASDESFGEKENLLTPTPAAFEPGHYGNRGAWRHHLGGRGHQLLHRELPAVGKRRGMRVRGLPEPR